MFNFGSPEDNALLRVQEAALSVTGPKLSDLPLDEMTLSEIRETGAYLYMTIRSSLQNGINSEELETLIGWYRQVFAETALSDPGFVHFIVSPSYTPPEGHAFKSEYLEILAELES